MYNIENYREFGKIVGKTVKGLKKINFSVSEQNFNALVDFPAFYFEEYVPDPNRFYSRGEVVKIGSNKYLLQGDGRIDVDRPPPENSLCKLFRDENSHDPDGTPRLWVREEWCPKGFERYYENPGRPQDDGWYRAKQNVGDATPPPNSMYWERVEE